MTHNISSRLFLHRPQSPFWQLSFDFSLPIGKIVLSLSRKIKLSTNYENHQDHTICYALQHADSHVDSKLHWQEDR
ncbi:MAG: hypothetical protein J5529_04320 [Prevotella sp.]|nr:hypothetical protein [Prevotella sp.]